MRFLIGVPRRMLHSDPRASTLALDGATARWRPHATASPELVLQVVEPQEFARERAVLDSLQGAPMLQALRLVRPEWYTDQVQVLAVFSWEDAPSPPILLREAHWQCVTWPARPARPAVGFASGAGVPPPDLAGRPVLLFGGDPAQPAGYARIRPI